MKSDERILYAIKTRQPLEAPFLSLGLVLKTGGVEAEGYLGMCSDRIAEAELIDGENVRIDFVNFPDLLLSADGVKKCQEILENYVSNSIITDAFEALCDEENIRAEINMMAGTLRGLGTIALLRTYARCRDKRIRKFITEEVYHRSFLPVVARQLRKRIRGVLVRVKYHRLLSAVDAAAKDFHSETKELRCR